MAEEKGNSGTEEEFDEVYNNIERLYEHAENILNSAHDESVENPEEFLAAIEPIVSQIEESANSISRDFAYVVENDEKPDNAMKRRVNSSLRKILISIEDFKKEYNLLDK